MAKFNLRVAALAACVGAILVIAPSAQSAVAQTTVEAPVCTATKWDQCSFEHRLAAIKSFCDTSGVPLKDNDRAKLAKASRTDFLGFFGCDGGDEPTEVADLRVRNNVVLGPTVVRHDGPRYRSFDNVAADSLQVRSHGKNYNLRNLRGDTGTCQAPRQWHRTEQCVPKGDGGVSCKMECR